LRELVHQGLREADSLNAFAALKRAKHVAQRLSLCMALEGEIRHKNSTISMRGTKISRECTKDGKRTALTSAVMPSTWFFNWILISGAVGDVAGALVAGAVAGALAAAG
jgi:hypothetical protein